MRRSSEIRRDLRHDPKILSDPEKSKRSPFQEGEVEIRRVAEAEDFGEEFTPELRAQEDRLREDAKKNKR